MTPREEMNAVIETTPEASAPVTEIAPAPDAVSAAEPAAADKDKAATSANPVSASAPVKRAYVAPAEMPTQSGPHGLRFDFNDGCRVVLPEVEGTWKIRLSDLDTGNILYETSLKGGRINSSKRYFVRFQIKAWIDGEEVFSHDHAVAGQPVLIQLPVGTLGDTMGWFPYAIRFQRTTGCVLTVAMAEVLIPLFREAYPEITLVTHEACQTDGFYATYNIGLFFDDADNVFQPTDFRLVGLHRTAGYILGVDPAEAPPSIVIPATGRPIAEPYVCIAVQSTTQSKYWNNPNGWREIVKFLKDAGYRVVCIDQKPVHGHNLVWNHIPHGVEDMTGDHPIAERARWLHHSAFFVGLSSGLSWLAWASGTPVVMISGFTHPTNEFATPYRVINYHTCNSCWNDPRVRFDHKDFLWCPRHANTPRQFECTRLITPDQVKAAIRRIPGFPAKAVEPAS